MLFDLWIAIFQQILTYSACPLLARDAFVRMNRRAVAVMFVCLSICLSLCPSVVIVSELKINLLTDLSRSLLRVAIVLETLQLLCSSTCVVLLAKFSVCLVFMFYHFMMK